MIRWVNIQPIQRKIIIGLELVIDEEKIQALLNLLSKEDIESFLKKIGCNSINELNQKFNDWSK